MSDGFNISQGVTRNVSIPLKLNDTNKTIEACRSAIMGKRKGIRALLPFLGPAFIASVAYIDPGNFATNIQSGSLFGYNMLWVVVLANLMAMLLQNMSAKLGIATGKNLPELCRTYFSKRMSYSMWGVSEIAAMATDLAEFLGATLGLNLLFGIPMLYATILTGLATYLILMLDRFGFRPLEKFIAAFAVMIGACYMIETIFSRPNFSQVAYHCVVPWLGNSESIMLAVGVIGATVMPHAIYLHSGLTQNRVVPQNDHEKIQLQKFNTKEVFIALGFAGLINVAMMYTAAAAFHSTGNSGVADIQSAYKTLTPILGSASASVFLISLLFSGISSSVVGTMGGQVIMQGFVGFSIPVWVRRIVTMLPTVIIVALGVDPTQTLVISQVILSIVLPIPIIALIYFTKRKDIMGVLVNKKLITSLSIICAVVISFLNLLLIYQTLGGSIPFIGN
ncbi:natural resistance-associated macrophage protein metal ion transporter NRAMP [Desulfosporosinus acidiphilus SJ4]|uniref:Divalent metal cation transporter MntH n=1 Tax=Desulfosporosinus acidiphilus (strain DSM 22704 / JCM 16185 / SJ4) TaxID=646529 RepID=I4D423_DESAJ|nr:Nramp family divalent metal transporter [Desulfosporosinus acidiphilus]AFM40547.1 natural resistance-associated macrophage protein metal ion transporter NRAMP [Desulfosporosinus acidiphilus SJ4]